MTPIRHDRACTEVANLKLRELWQSTISAGNWPVGIPQLWPLQYHTMTSGDLAFIGLNPSHNAADNSLLAVRGADDLSNPSRCAEVLRRDETAMGLHGDAIYRYFRPLEQFDPGRQFNHVDLLALRHMKQNDVLRALRLDKAPVQFVLEQMRICVDLVDALCPPCVVVVNARASRILMEFHDGLDLSWDEDQGHHWGITPSGRRPWFFSGMLSSAGQIDAHSRRRLIWHVRRTLTKIRESSVSQCPTR